MKYIFGGILLVSLLFSNTEAITYPVCSDCTVYATGEDGSLWGWSNGNFCTLSEKCTSNAPKTTKKKVETTTKVITYSKKKITSTTKREVTTKKNTTTVKTTSTSTSIKTDEKGNLICNGCEITATGGDKSLWGWENEKSCIIDSIKCNAKTQALDPNKAKANHTVNDAGFYVCNQCEVTETSIDGSYWGWEDEASCVIDNVKCNLTTAQGQKTTTPLLRGKDGILICTTCQYTEILEDTTTWNYENGERCRVIGSRCNFNTTPYPWCSGCVVTDYGEDGAAYGWENQNSCLVNEVSCGIINNGSDNQLQKDAAASGIKTNTLYHIIVSLIIILIIRY